MKAERRFRRTRTSMKSLSKISQQNTLKLKKKSVESLNKTKTCCLKSPNSGKKSLSLLTRKPSALKTYLPTNVIRHSLTCWLSQLKRSRFRSKLAPRTTNSKYSSKILLSLQLYQIKKPRSLRCKGNLSSQSKK